MNLKKIISAVTAFALSATMLVGFSANVNAADETVLYEKGTSDKTAWTSDDLTSWTQSGTLSLDETHGPMISGSNASHSAAMTISPVKNAIIKIDAVAYLNSATGRAFSAGNHSYFRFGNIYVMQNDQDKQSAYSLDGTDTYTAFAAKGVTYRAAWDSVVPHEIHMEIDTATNTLTILTVNGETKATNTVLSGADYTTVAFGYNKAGSVKGQTQTEALKSIKITQTEQEVTKADYNIKYVIPAEGEGAATVIKTVPLNGVVGTAPVVDTDDFVVDSQRYICDSNDASGKTIASDGSMVVTVNCHAAANYEMKVETSTGTEIKTENVVEHDSLTYSFSKYLTDANGKVTHTADNTTYSVTTTPTASDTITVPYTEYTGTAYFVEAEKVLSTTVDTQTTYSGGKARRSISTESDMITVAEDGIYTVAVAACSYNTNKGCTLLVNSKREGESNQIAEHSLDISWKYITEMTTENVALKEGDVITLVGGATNGTNAIVDYVLLTKTAELPVVTTGVASTVEGTSFPTLTGSEVFTNAADAEDTAVYSDLTTGKTVKTVYAKVKNSANAPVIKIGDAVQTSKWTAVGTTGIYFAQFVGSAEDFAEGGAFETVTITCDSAAPVTVDWSSAE